MSMSRCSSNPRHPRRALEDGTMPSRGSRVDPPPPPSWGSLSASSVEPLHAAARSSTASWWGSTAEAIPTDKHNGEAATPDFSSTPSDPTQWGEDPRPSGGFLSYFQNPCTFPFPGQLPHQLQNVHYVGGPAQYHPTPTPRPTAPIGIPSPECSNSSTPLTPCGLQSQPPVNVDSSNEDGEVRTQKRLSWTKEEDLRLMSSWLNNSNDPINGNYKKNDQYWGDVTTVFNSTTPKTRRRLVKQVKDRWHSINKLVYQFQCSWNKAFKIYSSGQSDDQLMDKAHAFYEADYKMGQFHHINCWKAVRDQPKWHTYNEWIEKTKKRKVSEAWETGEHTSSPTDMDDIPRPIGTKASKAERIGKGKAKTTTMNMEVLDKFIAAQELAKINRSGMLELQQRLSTEKLESAKITALAAKDKKEAKKLKKESEMMKTYRALIMQDTVGMTDEMKNEHVKALKTMREMLFGNNGG